MTAALNHKQDLIEFLLTTNKETLDVQVCYDCAEFTLCCPSHCMLRGVWHCSINLPSTFYNAQGPSWGHDVTLLLLQDSCGQTALHAAIIAGVCTHLSIYIIAGMCTHISISLLVCVHTAMQDARGPTHLFCMASYMSNYHTTPGHGTCSSSSPCRLFKDTLVYLCLLFAVFAVFAVCVPSPLQLNAQLSVCLVSRSPSRPVYFSFRVTTGNTDITTQLLARGACIAIADTAGQTALHFAAMYAQSHIKPLNAQSHIKPLNGRSHIKPLNAQSHIKRPITH